MVGIDAFDVLIKQHRIVCHSSTSASLNGSLVVQFRVAHPIDDQNTSLLEVAHQRLQDKAKDPQDQKIEMSFPVVAPLSYLPMVKLFSVKWRLQRDFLDMHKGQKTSEVVREKVIETRVIHPSQSIQISPANIFLHWSSNAYNSGMSPIVLFDHAHESPHC